MKHRGTVCILLGALLLLAAGGLSLYNARESRQAGARAGVAAQQLAEQLTARRDEEAQPPQTPEETPLVTQPQLPDYVRNPDMEMPIETLDGVEYVGLLSIPALELELPIINRWSYDALENAPCRFSGTAYRGNLVLCGHNYASHFGNLKELSIGDSLSFTDMDGHVFYYEVAELETLQPTETERLQSGDWPLSLFTCTYGGRTRFTVRCIALEKEE